MAQTKPGEADSENWAVQLRKGSLELAILASLWESRLYGLEIIRRLENDSDLVIVEAPSTRC